MINKNKTLVMKFGGSSISEPERFSKIAHIILKRLEVYPKIAVVVSAMGDMTDHLLELAKKVNPHPSKREVDMLISAGERISIALLAMALELRGIEAISFTGSQSGIITTDEHANAKIIDVKPNRLLPHLEQQKVVIVAGFQGVSVNKEITTLGRGGSDTTAIALAVALGADKVEFYKDVSGIFDADPKLNSNAKVYRKIDYNKALKIAEAGGVLHPRCISLASKNDIKMHVLSFLDFVDNQHIDQLGTIIEDDIPKYERNYGYEVERVASLI